MRKEHYDTGTGVWTVPKKDIESGDVGYMKSGREFAFQIPKSLRPDIERLVLANTQSDYVFTLDGSRPIHPESLTKNFKQFGEITTHGFRNTFKTWCLNNNVDHFLADRYVDHALLGLDKNYRRDDLFKQRAELAERYLEFVRA
jgi:integrase